MNNVPKFWLLALIASGLLVACSPVRALGRAPTPEIGAVLAGEPAVVSYVSVEIGVGSPIPVEVVIDSSFPDPCAQLVAVEQSRAGSDFELNVQTSPADAACVSPMGPLPFRFRVPLNAAVLQPGTYTVTVNGASTTFDYLTAGQ